MSAAVQTPAQALIPGVPAVPVAPADPAPKLAIAGVLSRRSEVRVSVDGITLLTVHLAQPFGALPIVATWRIRQMDRALSIRTLEQAEAWRAGDAVMVVGRGLEVRFALEEPRLRLQQVLSISACDMADCLGTLEAAA